MKSSLFYQKAVRKVKGIILKKINATPFQFSIYRSYWNYKLFSQNKKNQLDISGKSHYLGEKPNYGARIGHQLSNWNTGYYFAKYFNLQFAHFPFSNNSWETYMGFGENEIAAHDLIKDTKIKKVVLPRFDSEKKEQIELIRKIIDSYARKNIFFILEQDQSYKEQCGTAKQLSEKFFNAEARKRDKLIYSNENFNVAIHVRRGDIVKMKEEGSANWKERWLDNQYYADVTALVIKTLKIDKKIELYLFSQGSEDDFPEFKEFENLNYCLHINEWETFSHMVHADLLITSKSSFSYKPALISKGIKICPENFWHDYPSSSDFILADDNGVFECDKLIDEVNFYINKTHI